MSVDPSHGSVRLNQSGASDWPQYVLRREERDHTLDRKVRKRPDSKRLAVKLWLILAQLFGVAILLPWIYGLLIGVLFLDTSLSRNLVLALAYASYPFLLIISWTYSWERVASDRLLAACLISFVPVAASLTWVWSSIYVF
jgi:hypothetical protein